MNFLAATRAGTLLIARGKVTQSSGSLIFMDGALHTDDGCVSTAQAVMKRLTGRTTG
jgi:acyl-coenzyme A thioesterase PaaI-like protein